MSFDLHFLDFNGRKSNWQFYSWPLFLSFNFNFKFWNGKYKPTFNIYTSRTFQGYIKLSFEQYFLFALLSQKFGTFQTSKSQSDFHLECLGFTSFIVSHTCDSVFKSQDILWVYILFHTLSHYCKPRFKVTIDIFNIYK